MVKNIKLRNLLVSFALFPLLLCAQSEGILTCSFSPVFKSPSYQGTKSVLAVWIQDDQGGFVKTKMRYVGSTTSDHLPNWAVNSGGPASNALSSLCNKTDATTGATLPSFTAKTFTWDGHGVNGTSNGTVVADGIYRVAIQETWNHGSAGTTMQTYTFTKGPCEDIQTPSDDSFFTGISMVWEPTLVDTCLVSLTCPTVSSVTYTCSTITTGLERLSSLNPKINIAPNPGTSEITLQYYKATGIELMNTMGQIVYSEKLSSLSSGAKTLDVSQFPRGVYIVRVSNTNGTTGRKIVLTN